MIPFDFAYYRPASLQETVLVYAQLKNDNQYPYYYSGGSEIITMSRAGSIRPDAVIDIKDIPECNVLEQKEGSLTIGAACTLSRIKESRLFPLLGLACGRIADHTNQCRITLGGNLCGTIIYREASLPLLLADADITLHGAQGQRTVPFHSVFDGQMNLLPGEFVVQVHIPLWALQTYHVHIKHTTNEMIDYPLVNITALWKENRMRIAFSGLVSGPFRDKQIETILNEHRTPITKRVKDAADLLPQTPRNDVEGSGDYRIFVLKNTLRTLLEEYENGSV